MRISSISIRNLRSIEDLVLELPHDLTAIVGANSSGKSNVFRGFELFFTGLIDRKPFAAGFDMPSWIINSKAPAARTSIQVRFDLSDRGSGRLWKEVEKLFQSKSWPVPDVKYLTVIRYFSRGGASGFQCIIPTRGTRESECKELSELADLLIRRVEYRYVPSLKDLQSESFRQVSEELKGRLLSVWAGGNRKEVSQKREAFQAIRVEIEELIQGAAKGLSDSLKDHFPEVSSLKLAMASTQLEDMIGNLDIFADDGHETLMRQKGSGIQGASIIHMLRILRETAPRGANFKQLFLWNIEEPETFLHPSAQRRLSKLLRDQSSNTQILTTTHSPLFVDRIQPESNILIRRSNRAGHYCSATVKLPREDPMRPIRDCLGTSLADSLSLHEIVILVEGPSDVTIFTKAYQRLCDKKRLIMDNNYVVFVSGHGASQQATAFSILRSWSPLSKLGAIFDYDRAGRDDGAKRLKNATVDRDYFFLPHTNKDTDLEDFYSASIKNDAGKSNSIVKRIIIEERPDGSEISRITEWNKEQLAQYFVSKASDEDWEKIENFVERVVLEVAR
jgi:predicted ATP-dependent endonuclease of OLD family